MSARLTEVQVVQQEWVDRLTTTHSGWNHSNSINCLFLLINIVEAGPAVLESAIQFNTRLQKCYEFYLNQQNVVGRLQEKCKPRNDAGDDEDW